MKIVAIGDIHGNDCWKRINPAEYSKIVFLGDYTDSRYLSREKTLNNFIDILVFKREHPKKVELLVGNHDNQYLFYNDELLHHLTYLPHFIDTENYKTFIEIFEDHANLFKAAYQYRNYLFTHAGVTNMMFEEDFSFIKSKNRIAHHLNKLFKKKDSRLFKIGWERGGEEDFGSIFWADRMMSQKDYLKSIHQVVGHSSLEKIVRIGGKNESITYCDCLHKTTQFYELIFDGEVVTTSVVEV